MKLIEIVNSVQALNKLGEKDLPIQTSFKVTDILFAVEKELNNYYVHKDKLIQKYGTTENGLDYSFPEENRDKYVRDLEELNNMEIDLRVEKIKLPDNILIAPNALHALRNFIDREVI